MEAIIDKYLNYWSSLGLNKKVGAVVPEMRDPFQNLKEEWQIWHSIPSVISDDEIGELEIELGFTLPESYKRYLKYKHFYELQIGECSFCSHPYKTWKSKLLGMIYDGYPREYLIDKGMMPFADWSDWGHLCFDTNNPKKNSEYPIVLWDHDLENKFEYKYLNFEEMLVKLDEKEDGS